MVSCLQFSFRLLFINISFNTNYCFYSEEAIVLNYKKLVGKSKGVAVME